MYGCVGGGGVKQKPIVLDSTFALTDTCSPFILCVWGFTTWLMNIKTIYKITKLYWQRIKKKAHQKLFEMGARMTSSRSLVLFRATKCSKSEWAVHHSPRSCVTVSHSRLSFWTYKSTPMWACTLNLSTPPFFVSATWRESEHFQWILPQKHRFLTVFLRLSKNKKGAELWQNTSLGFSTLQ